MRNFTIIPNQIFEQSQLSVQSRFLYCVLLKFCGQNEWCFPGQITLGKILGYTDKHIRTLLNELIAVELISKKRSGWNRSNTYHVVKLLDTGRKLTSAPTENSNSHHLGNMVPIHNETAVPPINTYLKGKDKRSLKGLEKCRRELEKKGIIKHTTVVIKPKLNEYGKHLKIINKLTNY